MNQICKQCSAGFEITADDLAFYDKVSPVFNGEKYAVPPPMLCPPCRHQRRLSYRNERNLFHRKCDQTGKQIISQYSDPSITVYANPVWWSDDWSSLEYGRDVDFTRPFFEQFFELQKQVPRLSLINDSSNENSDYSNQTAFLKDCYLVFSSDHGERSYYIHGGTYFRSCVDCYHGIHCELCYECFECVRCYKLLFSQGCEGCSDSFFLRDCKGCKHCFGCSGLRNKEYCMFNEQLDKKTYEQRVQEFRMGNYSSLSYAQKQIAEWMLAQPVKLNRNTAAEESSGDFLTNVQNAKVCFDCLDIRDCTYCTTLSNGVVDCMDFDVLGANAELHYEAITAGYNSSRILFCTDCWSNVHDLLYCDGCVQSHNLFGCVAMKGASFCILNKQYTKNEYEKLVPRIIEHMKKTGEWGEFFPVRHSLFGYNESAAQEFFPLSKEAVMHNGWKWSTEAEKGQHYMGPTFSIPDAIQDASDDITQQILRCEVTGKPYKIIPQELSFYRDMGVPIPRKCPDQRHKERITFRNPRKLWDRICANCQKAIQTTYAPDRPEIVYCEECYLASVY